MARLDDEQRELLDAYADATRPTPAEVERALARTLARIENSKRSAQLPDGRRRVTWTVAASVAALVLATAAFASIRWLRAQPREPAPSYGEARFDRVDAEPGGEARAPAGGVSGSSSALTPGGEGAGLAAPESPTPDELEPRSADSLPLDEAEPGSSAESDSGEASKQAPDHAARRRSSKLAEPKNEDDVPEAAPVAQHDAAPAVDASLLADESRLLARARKALDADDFDAALDWVDEHARRHPDGALAEERLILEAVAACRGGQRQRGRASLATLRERFPGSPALAKVERACAE